MLWIRIGFSADLDPDPALHVNLDPDPRIRWSKIAIYYLLASIENVQASGEAASPRREHSALQTNTFLYFFCFLLVIFAHLDPDLDPADQSPCKAMRIRIHNTEKRMVPALRIWYSLREQDLRRLCHGPGGGEGGGGGTAEFYLHSSVHNPLFNFQNFLFFNFFLRVKSVFHIEYFFTRHNTSENKLSVSRNFLKIYC